MKIVRLKTVLLAIVLVTMVTNVCWSGPLTQKKCDECIIAFLASNLPTENVVKSDNAMLAAKLAVFLQYYVKKHKIGKNLAQELVDGSKTAPISKVKKFGNTVVRLDKQVLANLLECCKKLRHEKDSGFSGSNLKKYSRLKKKDPFKYANNLFDKTLSGLGNLFLPGSKIFGKNDVSLDLYCISQQVKKVIVLIRSSLEKADASLRKECVDFSFDEDDEELKDRFNESIKFYNKIKVLLLFCEEALQVSARIDYLGGNDFNVLVKKAADIWGKNKNNSSLTSIRSEGSWKSKGSFLKAFWEVGKYTFTGSTLGLVGGSFVMGTGSFLAASTAPIWGTAVGIIWGGTTLYGYVKGIKNVGKRCDKRFQVYVSMDFLNFALVGLNIACRDSARFINDMFVLRNSIKAEKKLKNRLNTTIEGQKRYINVNRREIKELKNNKIKTKKSMDNLREKLKKEEVKSVIERSSLNKILRKDVKNQREAMNALLLHLKINPNKLLLPGNSSSQSEKKGDKK